MNIKQIVKVFTLISFLVVFSLILTFLSQKPVYRYLSIHNSTNNILLHYISLSKYPPNRVKVAKFSEWETTLKNLAQDTDPMVRYEVVRNKKTSQEVLETNAQIEKHPRVIAANRLTSEEHMLKLARNTKNMFVFLDLLNNDSVTTSVINIIMNRDKDLGYEIYQSIAMHKKTEESSLTKIIVEKKYHTELKKIAIENANLKHGFIEKALVNTLLKKQIEQQFECSIEFWMCCVRKENLPRETIKAIYDYISKQSGNNYFSYMKKKTYHNILIHKNTPKLIREKISKYLKETE